MSSTTRAGDGGFTLIEVLVSIALISILMAALTTFFVRTGATNSQQAAKQLAIQLTDDAAERLRAMKGSGITHGRDKTSSDTQWSQPVSGVEPYLTDMQETWDAGASYPAGASATLPTSPMVVTVNNLAYGQNWYIGKCWQPPAGGDCGPTQLSGYAEFFRVVIAVTWPERNCTAGQCSYLSATLVSTGSGEPVFNPSATAVAPAVDNPGTQIGDVGVPVGLQLSATNGAPPLTWSATSLPPGVTMSTGGLLSGTPTAAGSYLLNVSVIDGFGLTGSASFSWVISPKPVLTNPGSQSSQGGVATSLTLAMTGGTAPVTWSVTAPGGWGSTGLPPGLALNAATGVISGIPTAAASTPKSVTVTVTDAVGGTSSATFSWAVPALALANPGNQAGETSASVTLPVTATGGVRAYTWAAAGLPPGLAIDSTGTITGSATSTGSYAVTVTVTDTSGAALTVGFTWTVNPGPHILTPNAGTRNDSVGTTVSLSSSATSGSGSYVWTATNLPPGLAINASTGLISGKITAGTRFFTTVVVLDSLGGTDSFDFIWNVNASGSTLRVTYPNGDLSGAKVGDPVSFTATASGGSGFTWKATGLPPGAKISTAGAFSGTLTTAGIYVVTLVATNSTGASATFMFSWTVQ